MLKPQFNHSNGSSANRAERANVVADRQPDLDNASAGISLHMYFVRVCRPPRTIFGGLFWLTKPLSRFGRPKEANVCPMTLRFSQVVKAVCTRVAIRCPRSNARNRRSPTTGRFRNQVNEPVRVYDTSGNRWYFN